MVVAVSAIRRQPEEGCSPAPPADGAPIPPGPAEPQVVLHVGFDNLVRGFVEQDHHLRGSRTDEALVLVPLADRPSDSGERTPAGS